MEHMVKWSDEFVTWSHKCKNTFDKQGNGHRCIWDQRTISSSMQHLLFSIGLFFLYIPDFWVVDCD